MITCVCLLLMTTAQPEPAAPGNVYLSGDAVRIPLSASMEGVAEGRWRVLDDTLSVVGEGSFHGNDGQVCVGELNVGWYRIEFTADDGHATAYTTAAVLMPLAGPVPEDTPVALDVALSWVPADDPGAWEAYARLASLAGVAMVRDRLRWRDIQPEPGALAADTKYDRAAAIQRGQNLAILQTYHDTPPWVWRSEADRGRIPADLRVTWRFCRDLARRFNGAFAAWEAWNEGNASNFGGHTIDELCAHQKAAFLGFRAGGGTSITVCWNPLGGVNTESLCQGVVENETAAYFDVYTIHSYDWNHDFRRLWIPARRAAAHKPIWVTEADRGLQAEKDSEAGDFSHDNDRRKAAFMGQSIASSLAAGSSRHFHFILPQYMEQQNTIQFGLLRKDLTPRMAYVACAAAGRLLAGARYLGRWMSDQQEDVYVEVFRTLTDGTPHDVLAAWVERRVDWAERGQTHASWALPGEIKVESAWDYLGRPMERNTLQTLSGAVVYLVLPEGESAKLGALEPLPEVEAVCTEGVACPIVMQCLTSDNGRAYRMNGWTPEYDHAMSPGIHERTISLYNFGDARASGVVEVETLPDGWQCEPSRWELALEPMERHDQVVRLTVPDTGPDPAGTSWLKFRGRFGETGTAALAFRVLPLEQATTSL